MENKEKSQYLKDKENGTVEFAINEVEKERMNKKTKLDDSECQTWESLYNHLLNNGEINKDDIDFDPEDYGYEYTGDSDGYVELYYKKEKE